MIEESLDDLQAPFRFLGIDVDYLKRRLVVDRMRPEVPEVSYSIDDVVQILRQRFPCVLFIKNGVDLIRKIVLRIALVTKNRL